MENNAWLTLVQLIKRGDKPAAVQLCRLLAATFDDRAYALQLEGDVLLAFRDTHAFARYRHAAQLYMQAGQEKLAASMLIGADLQAHAHTPGAQRLE